MLAEAFLPNPDNKKCVLFKNDDPKDLRLDNLTWDNGAIRKKEDQKNGIKDKPNVLNAAS